jgi:hypothetical protein
MSYRQVLKWPMSMSKRRRHNVQRSAIICLGPHQQSLVHEARQSLGWCRSARGIVSFKKEGSQV